MHIILCNNTTPVRVKALLANQALEIAVGMVSCPQFAIGGNHHVVADADAVDWIEHAGGVEITTLPQHHITAAADGLDLHKAVDAAVGIEHNLAPTLGYLQVR